MRYAIVTETFPPEVNGVALTVASLAAGLRDRGHDVRVVRPRQPAGDTGGDLELPGLPVPRYPGLRFGLPATRLLRREWDRQRPDAIYIATEGPLGWSALRAARHLRIPVATGFHTRFDHYMAAYGVPFLASVAMAWMRRFHAGADATLVPTRELEDTLHALRFRKVARLARAVDTRRFDPAHRDPGLRRSWGAGNDTPVLLHVGRISPEKNLRLAVRAFRALQAIRPDARFAWVGDGPERARLERTHPEFIFCGVRRGEDLARAYASADLFVFPSRSETFGNVTLEALASGLPTVAFDYGAAREYLRDGIAGAAPADGDEKSFIHAVMRLGNDPGLRAPMRIAARESVSGLRPENVAADFDALLQSLAQGEADGRPAAA